MNDANLYDRAYFDDHYLDDPRRDAMYLQEVARINDRLPAGGRVLDIGCGVGNFLNMLDDRWWKYGFEPSKYAAEKARAKGIVILDGISPYDTEYFDLVVFRGTLQHISRPMETIESAAAVLKPGGMIVFLATPDADSLVYHLFGTLPALDPPRNWIVMGAKSLRNILTRLGFQHIETIHPYFGTPYARPLADFSNFLLSFISYRKFAFPGNQFEMYAVKQ